jgi:Cu2+-containing amine oxidase
MRSLSRPVLFLIGSVLAPVLLFAQNQPPADPLDALKTQEYWSVYDVLRDSGKLDSDTVTHSVLLHEP